MRTLFFNRRGVTIIELLVVVLLLSILAGLAIAQMQKVAARQEFVSDVDSVIDDFKIAQSWARNSILEQEVSQSVVSYQIVSTEDGYTRRRHFGDGTDKVLASINLTTKNIEVVDWPAVAEGSGFEFKVPSGRVALLDGQPILGETVSVTFRHTRLDETISVTIDSSGAISR